MAARDGIKVRIAAGKASQSRIVLYEKGGDRVRQKFNLHTCPALEGRHTCGVMRGVY
jgi:hypothetical protein